VNGLMSGTARLLASVVDRDVTLSPLRALLNLIFTTGIELSQRRNSSVANQGDSQMNSPLKTETKTPAVKTEKAKRVPASLCVRVKSQLSAAAFRNKITPEELKDLEQFTKKLSEFLGA
jgi:hypothetical protein